MNTISKLSLTILVGLSLLFFTACSKEDKSTQDMDKAGESLKDTADQTGDALKDATNEAKDKLEESQAK